ncbi:TetR/AcrR family transcriptional regulator C-terminal ligand-binding domain-containing protein [Sporosarcina sp. ACRSM]|uniref:TetR/AcrR family transcriptional regulator n=1 Tax=Sporosarcina sp. ACRSM TaxID=2918216 RepID=UPI001EF737D7|nr:TetR-like C-terminal domain-containing protein [Sporosarcina sp. ACRSM]MCG7337570.1 TetR/AcrR family transcriptional regulator C-terminal ligand-binding domain-containing protein [Sporosarcina sp. ACRSM]
MIEPKARGARNRTEIVNATIEILEEVNFSTLTIEAVAARSGAGKATLYRWWKRKSDIVFDAFMAKSETLFEFDPKKSIDENFIQQLLTLTEVLKSGVGRSMMTVITEEKDIAAEFLTAYLTPRRAETKKMLQAGIDKGEIRDDLDFDVVLDMLYGPIYFNFILCNRIPDQTYIEKLVRQVMR